MNTPENPLGLSLKNEKKTKTKNTPHSLDSKKTQREWGTQTLNCCLFGITTAESSNASVFVSKQNSIYMQTAGIVALCS